jgi:phosphate transport system permease protein
MKSSRKATIKQMLTSYRRSPSSLMLRVLVILAAATTAFILLTIIGYIVMRGIPHINAGLFAWEYTTENVSMMPAIINTITMTALALALAVPIGIFSAIYLVEYARRGNRLVSLVRITAETLSGIPSIVYGLFGFLLFAISLGWGLTFLGGALTLAVMILPLVMRTTEEALIAVPDMYREGSFGLGAGKLRTVFQIVLPAAIPGILAGVILSIGRIVGETAALIFSAGTIAGVPSSLMDSGRTLSVHMYALLSEGLYMDEAYATAVILLLLVVVINTLSAVVARAFSRR